ncbi:pyridoxamine 5'-phosphate oxidase family protein [Neobacillus ginsengisoli]|uniref:Pyridoxine 5'-phosphate oxidase superfamily flavin-nucleotide-binding protein n=1 Tax=Neobacillus ginsengisoli TaxID=904295 RepID=A0ABT9XZW3_9BACI|nr:pyridoxamine 5'-phosphate oxidase family protein [Neobacillus ginsengisoli]MDQ0201098.1 putative pyridoxine 5'-phosphate oxidase superfamily flavin-nucleotide-binding protein [Neobacillus ginsengisoli]
MERGEHILQEQHGTTKKASSFYENQMLNYLNDKMKEFISKQAMMFIATADSEGNCDSSFRAGSEGFVRVIDDTTLIYPEYRGNGVMASLGNIVENPHIGLMFIDFFENNIGLHVNGKASIIESAQLDSLRMTDDLMKDIEEKEGNYPERWVAIKVEEAYIHCSKHIPKLKYMDKNINWGTDDEKQKGGDFFKAKHSIKV